MLEKRGIDISFAQGLDTKTDPKRVQMGKFLRLVNTVFDKGGLLQKRNGYPRLASLPDTTYSYLTTFNDTLTAVGPTIAAYSPTGSRWLPKGVIQPLSLSVQPVIRNNLNQSACDIAIAPSGAACAVYIETNGTTATNKYVIFDSATGQNLKAPAVIPVASGTVSGGMRVFVLGNNFVLVFTNTIAGADHLQYVTVNIVTPTTVGTNTDIAAVYVPATTVSWDGYVVGNNLYIAYNTATGGQSVKVTYLTSTGTLVTPTTFATYKATMMSVTADVTTPSNPVIYATFYRSDTGDAYTLGVNQGLSQVLAPTNILTVASGVQLNVASAAQNGICYSFFETQNAYTWTTNLQSNYIRSVQVVKATAGVTIGKTISGAGLASKAAIVSGKIYLLAAYASPYQNTYFLVNGSDSSSDSPVVAARLAYQNGGGYLTQGLPSVTVVDSSLWIGYLFKDVIQAVNKNTNVPTGSQVNGIFSQTGVNLSTFAFGTDHLDTAEIGNDLHISGGLLWMYDGYLPVEHNFLLYPDVDTTTMTNTAAWTQNSVVTPTGTWSSGSTSVVVSSATGISVGMTITDTSNATYIPAGTTILAIVGTTLTISAATTSAAAGDNLSIQGNIVSKPDTSTNTNAYFYQFTYEWTDNQGNAFRSAPSIPVHVTTTGTVTTGVITLHIPMLRATMKVANPVKIVIYRWSVGQQAYYQVTSLTTPQLNLTNTDTLTYVDTLADATILGNNLLYTSGGVVEDVAPPGSDVLSLFDTRLWLADAEDRNLLWFSKQVIEATPVEMSDLFTIFVPPTVATATGEITALAPMDDKLIISKGGNSFVYINGTGPDNTGANNQYSPPIFITSTVGCANQRSIVLIPQGLMFQSNKGIWLLERGLGTSYIGAGVQDLTQGATVNSAVAVPGTNQVRFTLDTGVTLMYDYFYDQWGSFYNVPCVSSCIYGGMHTFMNDLGAAHQEEPGVYLDGSNPVLMSFQTGPIRLGDLQNYQRAYFFYLLGTYITPHKLQVSVTFDYETAPSQTVMISPTNFSTAYGSGSSQSPYGQGTPYGGPSNIESWRIFLANQRCMAFSISVQEIYDNTLGVPAGAGLTLSGISVIAAFKKAYRPQPNVNSAG